MQLGLKLLGFALAIGLGIYAAIWVASESGEVVVLTTTSEDGSKITTRLWVVEHDTSAWLRSGSSAAAWYQRLRGEPTIQLLRGQQVLIAEAQAEPELTPIINALMKEKYAWADDFISALFGREDAIAIRLVPAIGAQD